jgi:ankyrin repeat protein
MLMWASARGLLADAAQLIALGTPINCKDKRGISPLHYASSHGRNEIMECLISRGADLDAECQRGRTPLHYASASGQMMAAKLLLSKKAWVDSMDSMDDTPLHLAARQGYASICQLLLLEGKSKSIEMRNKRGLTTLGEAVLGNHVEAIEALMDRGCKVGVEAKGFNLLHLAAILGFHEPIHVLLDPKRSKQQIGGGDLVNGLSSNKEAISPLHAAIMSLSVDCVEILLKNGADPGSLSSSGQTPLDLLNWNAVKRGMEKDEDIQEIRALLTSALSKRPKKQAQAPRPVPTRAEEPALSFEALPRHDQIKKVEAWSHHPDISSLSHLNESTKKALMEVSRVSKLLESLRAVAALRSDAEYQKDVLSEHVKHAMMDIQQTNDMAKYRDDRAVMQVCSKLNKVQALLRTNGSLPPNVSILQETLVANEGPNSLAETNKRIQTLESMLETITDHCISAMGGKTREEHDKETAQTQVKSEPLPPLLSSPDKPVDHQGTKEAVDLSMSTWTQRLGKDLLIQITVASLMMLFAFLWIRLGPGAWPVK